ncbi:Ldh family oxidoreductase [Pelagibius litoralis]|uniref:Ldh family oxidoreductase n=1 Tax=Pelagibius litoralis TaxID=374515 RepID=A0A967F0K6_9PROT|nr:Ldh family oxidoreductase [Pelagibius litoralis]NIA70938.1 Ldh family oxidoreductase [Pelagibius litoralis]
MSEGERFTLAEARDLAVKALVTAGTAEGNALSVATALVAAEADGQKGHGLSRLASYAGQVRTGKVKGAAEPQIERLSASAIRVDAGAGFAFPALDCARDALVSMARSQMIAVAAVYNSHHFGQGGYHVERLAEQGLVGLMLGNSPQAIAPWGGTQGLFGTNPIAMAAPRREAPPLVIDLSLAKVARGKVMAAAKTGQEIPEGWALDAEGRPTRDPEAALAGTMIPMGEAKGAALAMLVEILSATLVGANHGFEASSFFTAEGPPPGVGQLLLAFDPTPLSGGGFADRLEILVNALQSQPGARLPGTRRLTAREVAERDGLLVPAAIVAEIKALLR